MQALSAVNSKLLTPLLLTLPRLTPQYTIYSLNKSDESCFKTNPTDLQSLLDVGHDCWPRPNGHTTGLNVRVSLSHGTVFLLIPYLEIFSVTICSDYNALHWNLNMWETTGKIARWRVRLWEFKTWFHASICRTVDGSSRIAANYRRGYACYAHVH